MWIAKWNNKEYKLQNSININKSSREVTYTDLAIDFSNCTIEDLPYAQQEVEIYDNENKLKFTGFVADYKLPELRTVDIDRELKLSLFTPRQMSTKRSVTIITTDKFTNVIRQILAPLFQDGFTLKELNIEDKTITVNLISRTVEEVLNYLSKKYSLYWNIDENKNMVINSIEYMFNKPISKNIDITNYTNEIKGLISITPSVENSDYANIINVKNARVFYDIFNTNLNVQLKNGDRLDFENPVDISLATAKRVAGNLATQGADTGVLNLMIIYNGNQEASITSAFNANIKDELSIKNIATDDSSGAKFVLTMDSMFKNLATGVTYKGEGTIMINQLISQTALRYANMKLINWEEIEKSQGKITPSGQIEKTVDVKESWFTTEELIEYIRNLFTVNDKGTNQITINCDENNEISVGDRLQINLPEILTIGNFIVTDIKENIDKNFPTLYTIQMRNTNLLENYIDLFRSSIDIEEQTSQVEMEYVVEYEEEETIKETHQVELDSNYNNTLNFILRG